MPNKRLGQRRLKELWKGLGVSLLTCATLSLAIPKPALAKEEGAGTWQKTSSPSAYDSGMATATLLETGEVLLAGGNSEGKPSPFAEIFNSVTAKWQPTSNMHEARRAHTATRMLDGRVLVVGGFGKDGPLETAEVFEPISRKWFAVGSIQTPRAGHTANLLRDGRILVVGGFRTVHGPFFSDTWIFDPTKDLFTPGPDLILGRGGQSATLLENGDLLIVGGRDAAHAQGVREASLFDNSTNSWMPTRHLPQWERGDHAAARLKDGRVLLVGGSTAPGFLQTSVKTEQLLRNGEIYDPSNQEFSKVSAPNTARLFPTATTLHDGKVLIAGGHSYANSSVEGSELVELGQTSQPQIYDPGSGRWIYTGLLPKSRVPETSAALVRARSTATLLNLRPCDGECARVLLVTGGEHRAEAFVYSEKKENQALDAEGGKSLANPPLLLILLASSSLVGFLLLAKMALVHRFRRRVTRTK